MLGGEGDSGFGVRIVCASVVDSVADVPCVNGVVLGDGGLSCGGAGGV